ncbi:MAG: thioredoxin fold domain-containing protein [Gammaproteobacteria bacterium]|nr:thioredoxin fold domain-containing protein [Gammaproteobacteria bacterium]
MTLDTVSPLIFDVGERGFQEQVIQHSEKSPILVDFWADWCAPCRTLAPALERVIEQLNGQVSLAKVEVDENMRLAGHYRIRGFPTVILFHKKQELGRFSGARPAHWIKDWIYTHGGQYLPGDASAPADALQEKADG